MRICVITPAYNVSAFVGAAVRSVIGQSHRQWSMLLIDDGSTDGTAEIVEQFAEPRITVIRQANAGVSAARNRGIVEADAAADALLFLDADDWLAPDALARLSGRLQSGNDVAAYGPFRFASEDGATLLHAKTGPFPEGDIVERLVEENLFANGGHLLVRRSAIVQAGQFRADLRYGEDWEYWCRLALVGSFGVTSGTAPLLYVRQRASGAYLRMAFDPAVFAPCMDAIFGNPALAAHLGAERMARLRRRTEAENAWIVGRELVRHGHAAEGRAALRRAVMAKPGLKRGLLLATAHVLALLPPFLHGPFRRYRAPRSGSQ